MDQIPKLLQKSNLLAQFTDGPNSLITLGVQSSGASVLTFLSIYQRGSIIMSIQIYLIRQIPVYNSNVIWEDQLHDLL